MLDQSYKGEIGSMYGFSFTETHAPWLVYCYAEYLDFTKPYNGLRPPDLLPTPAPWLWLVRGFGQQFVEKEGASPEGEAP